VELQQLVKGYGLNMKKLILWIVAVLVLTGCASTPKANSEFSSADISFAEEMIPHHEQAILMSDIALTNSTSDEILALARDIKAAQAPEIEEMGSWTGVNPSNHMGHMMDGMLNDEQIQQLRDSEGATFDRLFLEGMIAHHEGAIKMAQKVIDSKSKKVADIAATIIDAQEKEIAFMRELIKFY
jgi:uncharacterized protein (DUF305 family)